MKLLLKDGTIFEGKSFGAAFDAAGEVVFNTGMVGYPESLTDPSYAGQILVLTYPLVGNYGVPSFAKASKGKPDSPFESNKVQIAGLVVSEYSEKYSHRQAKQSLSEWLKKSGVPAMTGVDTRALTKRLREHGVLLGELVHSGKPKGFVDPNEENLVARVNPKRKKVYKGGKTRIIAVDCGMKENIVRSLVARGATVIRVPWDYDFNKEKYDGLLLSNGPGDPTMCSKTIENIRTAMKKNKPILGVCLGNQLLALAAGASTYKLKYGHRSQNQPCLDISSRRCYITSQNHGYAVDGKSLPTGWEEWFVNANDGSNEGIRHKSKPWRSAQFHPEASPGPTDTAWIFDEFIASLKK
ncbi:carbamoyl phosphate synthase small subunit [Candidatus Kaiserbacteria bacterium RIFCSPLOWO2_01_FULL_54_13]|uniref:Carbamoyl phosphate synthase small chain n=1 Tax=Candidatus Kaiserbacteria bacterium RIFCSPLOWO2_01_FULL_54_13 TaxID=1798512 RepID=A0A1F6F3J9_9BACT|nr:MAG: carbamoyl phosphate synthase small subunit [Candidatus Kaiserbacteria bacterium RIFCSPLOWO2_01_FULL_54_13]